MNPIIAFRVGDIVSVRSGKKKLVGIVGSTKADYLLPCTIGVSFDGMGRPLTVCHVPNVTLEHWRESVKRYWKYLEGNEK